MAKFIKRYTIYIALLFSIINFTPTYSVGSPTGAELCTTQETSVRKTREITAEVTAYTASSEENGGYEGLTVEGKPLEEGHIASDDLPLETKVIIKDKEYIVADTFGGNYRNRIDVFMPSRADAYRFGRQHLTVQIVEEE